MTDVLVTRQRGDIYRAWSLRLLPLESFEIQGLVHREGEKLWGELERMWKKGVRKKSSG